MNCSYHPERIAVAVCQGCGKGLCLECAEILNIPLCISCIKFHVSAVKKEMIKCIVGGLIIGIFTSIYMQNIAYFIFAWIPFGYAWLNKFKSDFFVFMPVVGWLLYFLVKVIIALCIGWIALPIKLYQWIKIIFNASAIEEKLNGGF